MNDFIYVSVDKSEAEAIGYDAEKAFAKGWTSSTDGWLKKVPVSEYRSENIKELLKKQRELCAAEYYGYLHDPDNDTHNLILNAPEPSISSIQEDALSLYQPWPLHDVLNKLVEVAEILLLKKNYDGHGWEEIKHAVDAAKQYKPQRSPIQEDWKGKFNEWFVGYFKYVDQKELKIINDWIEQNIINKTT